MRSLGFRCNVDHKNTTRHTHVVTYVSIPDSDCSLARQDIRSPPQIEGAYRHDCGGVQLASGATGQLEAIAWAFNRLRLGRTTKQRAHLATQEFIQCLHVQLHVELLVNAGDVGADGIDADVAETFWCADSSPDGVRRVLCDGPSPTPARAAEQN